MFKKRKTERPAISRGQALKSVPVRNREVSEEPLAAGGVRLAYPVTVRPWFARLARRLGAGEPPVRQKKLDLDELGASVWGMIDGKRTVGRIIEDFARAHRFQRREADMSVTLFLRQLGQRGIIGIK